MKEMIKLYIQILSCTVFLGALSYASFAEEMPAPKKHGHPPQFTEEQRSCLEGILGKPGEGTRPTKEQMRAAAEACDIPPPPDKPEHGERPEPPEE